PASVGGAAMAIYTGALLAATSTPLWAAAPRLLPAVFGASAMASAAAALSLGESEESRRTLDPISLAASATELLLSLVLRWRWRLEGVDGALRASPWGLAYDLGPTALGAGVPALWYGLGAIVPALPRRPSPLVAAMTLADGFALRHIVLRAGNVSATRPRDYFHFARPRGAAAR
ncbi:MAG TPA: hypothetical protein VJ770_19065, partial [Stellaceae bacterium]|nr:hypothetical protein [Stellaceae bacterium]